MSVTRDRYCSCLRYTAKIPKYLCHHDWTCYAECGSPTRYCSDECTPCCSTGKCACPCHELDEYTCDDVFGDRHGSSAHDGYCDATGTSERPVYNPVFDTYADHYTAEAGRRRQTMNVLGLPTRFHLRELGKYTPRFPDRIEEVPCPVELCASHFAQESTHGRGVACTHPARVRALRRAQHWWRGVDPVSGAVWGTTVWVSAWRLDGCSAYFGCPLCGDTHLHGFSSNEAAGKPVIRRGHCTSHETSLAIPTGEAVTAAVLSRTSVAKHANPVYMSTQGFFAADVSIVAALLGSDFGLKERW
ncbi:hypothetical protein ACT17_06190 [Mycolicibacterium conceptionense]|uniref:Uncharacterized protein n=1 Tax=Mycolicibacterium conceptionense TaxID=451644 RepID=A0A0J8UDM1_9MYCO|nr:hypothetical protein [Mycolicibacterium conceptionense]KMV19628.1 hypothetical protein ACT17_06190 [Mycolicibacterium conceptionense]